MSWLPFALFSAIVLASRRTYEKQLTKSFSNFTLGFIIQVFSLLPTLALFFFLPLPANWLTLSWSFWWPLLIIWIVLYPIQTYFTYRALREGELSHVTPVMAMLPVFNTATSFLMIGEKPSLHGLAGIVVMVIGTYLLMTDNSGKGYGQKYNRAVVYMLAATVCVAIGSTLDKISIAAATPVFYSFVNSLGATLIFLTLTFVYKQSSELKQVKTMIWPLTLLGIFQALSYTAAMQAFEFGPTAYVLAVRSSSFLFAGLLGIFIMKEKITVAKMIAFALFLIGIFLLSLIN